MLTLIFLKQGLPIKKHVRLKIISFIHDKNRRYSIHSYFGGAKQRSAHFFLLPPLTFLMIICAKNRNGI
jgi:hypothetical protein